MRSAGFITSDMISSQNAVNFAYILYLRGRKEGLPAAELEQLVRRWFAMSVLRGRYSASPESQIDSDIRQVESKGVKAVVETVIATELPESFWTGMLPQFMATSSIKSPYFLCFKAAQGKLGDKGFLSTNITVTDLLLNRSDIHHVYPRQYLKGLGFSASTYNQIANYVVAQSEINIVISATAPETYFATLAIQCKGGASKYGGITGEQAMRDNLRMHCIPDSMLDGEIKDFNDFLEERRKLMALKVKAWFEIL